MSALADPTKRVAQVFRGSGLRGREACGSKLGEDESE